MSDELDRGLRLVELFAQSQVGGGEEPAPHFLLPAGDGLFVLPLTGYHKDHWETLARRAVEEQGDPAWYGFLVGGRIRASRIGRDIVLVGVRGRHGGRRGHGIPIVTDAGRIVVLGKPLEDSVPEVGTMFGNPWLRPPPVDGRTTTEPAPSPPAEFSTLWADMLSGLSVHAAVPEGVAFFWGSKPTVRGLGRLRRSQWRLAIRDGLKQSGGASFMLVFASNAYLDEHGEPAFEEGPGAQFLAMVCRERGKPATCAVMPYQWTGGRVESAWQALAPTPAMKAYLDRVVPDPWLPDGKLRESLADLLD
jgi:hypothetical protein